MNSEINKVLQQPHVRSILEPIGAVLVGGTAEEFSEFLNANFSKFRKIMAFPHEPVT